MLCSNWVIFYVYGECPNQVKKKIVAPYGEKIFMLYIQLRLGILEFWDVVVTFWAM